MDYFTSDLHLGHALMLKDTYDSQYRKLYASMEEHDQGIIDKINSRAKSGDKLYILGDVSYHKPMQTSMLMRQIKADIILIKGNHDHPQNKSNDRLPEIVMQELSEYHTYLERKFTVSTEGPAQLICMMHFPITHWHKQHYGSWMLHGHLHGNPSGVSGKIEDVGWCKHGKVLSLKDICTFMESKPVRANHHI